MQVDDLPGFYISGALVENGLKRSVVQYDSHSITFVLLTQKKLEML